MANGPMPPSIFSRTMITRRLLNYTSEVTASGHSGPDLHLMPPVPQAPQTNADPIRTLDVSVSALNQVIPDFFGTEKCMGMIHVAWTASDDPSDPLYIGVLFHEGPMLGDGSTPFFYINDEPIWVAGGVTYGQPAWVLDFALSTGAGDQSVNSVLAEIPGFVETYPYWVHLGLKLDKEAADIPGALNVALLTTGRVITDFRSGVLNAVDNPVVCAASVLSDWRWLGKTLASTINTTNWTDAADWSDDAIGYAGAARWHFRGPIYERDPWAVIENLLTHCQAKVFTDGDGKLKLDAAMPKTATGVHVGANNWIKHPTFQERHPRNTWPDLYTVWYRDGDLGGSAPVTVATDDEYDTTHPAWAEERLDGCFTNDMAGRWGKHKLRQIRRQPYGWSGVADETAANLTKGDRFTFDTLDGITAQDGVVDEIVEVLEGRGYRLSWHEYDDTAFSDDTAAPDTPISTDALWSTGLPASPAWYSENHAGEYDLKTTTTNWPDGTVYTVKELRWEAGAGVGAEVKYWEIWYEVAGSGGSYRLWKQVTPAAKTTFRFGVAPPGEEMCDSPDTLPSYDSLLIAAVNAWGRRSWSSSGPLVTDSATVDPTPAPQIYQNSRYTQWYDEWNQLHWTREYLWPEIDPSNPGYVPPTLADLAGMEVVVYVGTLADGSDKVQVATVPASAGWWSCSNEDSLPATDYFFLGLRYVGGEVTLMVNKGAFVSTEPSGSSPSQGQVAYWDTVAGELKAGGGAGSLVDADTVDGQHASAFAAASHTHPGTDITSQVDDSDKVDGEHAAAFLHADGSVEITGNQVMSNNVNLKGKNSGGTARQLAFVATSDVAVFGDNNIPGRLRGSSFIDLLVGGVHHQMLPLQSGSAAPTVGANFPNSGDFGFYLRTFTGTMGLYINYGGTLYQV